MDKLEDLPDIKILYSDDLGQASRAEDSLALIAYTTGTEQVRNHALREGWFNNDEIELIVSP